MIYARKGERVTCTNGHVIGVFTRDHMVGEALTVDSLTQTAVNLIHGKALGFCPTCGASWNGCDDAASKIGILHVEGGWRRPRSGGGREPRHEEQALVG